MVSDLSPRHFDSWLLTPYYSTLRHLGFLQTDHTFH